MMDESAPVDVSQEVVDIDTGQPFVKERTCTNCCCLLWFLLYWGGMLCIGILAFWKGDTNRLKYALDNKGNMCGVENKYLNGTQGPDFRERKLLYWLDPFDFLEDVNPYSLKTVCVESCPNNLGSYVCEYNDAWQTIYNVPLEELDRVSEGLGPCYTIYMETFPLHGRCIPKTPKTMNNVELGLVGKQISSISDKIYDRVLEMTSTNRSRDYLLDWINGWAILLGCGCLEGIFLSYIWIAMMRFFTRGTIWLTVILANLFCIGYTISCFVKSGKINARDAVGQDLDNQLKDSPSGGKLTPTMNKNAFLYYGIALIIVSFLLLLISVFLSRRLARRLTIASSCMATLVEALDSVRPIPSSVQVIIALQPGIAAEALDSVKPSSFSAMIQSSWFPPLVPSSLSSVLILLVWWCTVTILIFTCGTLKQQSDGAYTYAWDAKFQLSAIYHCFGLFWSLQFLVGFNDVVIAGSISYFYWCRTEALILPSVSTTMKRTMRYNLGSIALGSLLFAPFHLLIRSIVHFFNSILQWRMQTSGQSDPPPCFFCCGRCLVWVEKVNAYIDRQVYIVVAAQNKDYCTAANSLLNLVIPNLQMISNATETFHIFLWLGKVFVAAACGVGAFCVSRASMFSDTERSRYLSSPIFVVLSTTIIGFLVSHIFSQVYATTLDTLMVNLCKDIELNSGMPQNMTQALSTLIQDAMAVDTVADESNIESQEETMQGL